MWPQPRRTSLLRPAVSDGLVDISLQRSTSSVATATVEHMFASDRLYNSIVCRPWNRVAIVFSEPDLCAQDEALRG